MSKFHFRIHGGDYRRGKAYFRDGWFSSYFNFPGLLWSSTRRAKDVTAVELVTDDMVAAGTTRAGAAGIGFLLGGPILAALGALAGGKQKKQTTFVVRFCDGKSFLGTSDTATFHRLKSLAL